ncbi:MAG: hypothetical protein ACJ79E_09450 [Anaeromyxobacteraceae bacterium]
MHALWLVLAVSSAALSRDAVVTAADGFASRHASARVLRSGGGGLRHASGFAAPRLLADDDANARRFLAREGRAFGVASDAELETLRVHAPPGGDGVAVYRQTLDGLPVFGGRVAVAWRKDGAITLVNASPWAGLPAQGAFAVDEEAARRAALGAVAGAPGTSSVERGWLARDGALVPAFRVLHDTAAPVDAFVTYVDGATGAVLRRSSRTRRAATCPPGSCANPPCICAFRVSPLAPRPTSADGNAPELFDAVRLRPATATRLEGDVTTVLDCKGEEVDLAACRCLGDAAPEACRAAHQLAALDGATRSFRADPDPTQTDVGADAFAEQSAYYHITAHSLFLSGLDPSFAGIGFIPGFVNVYAGGAPLDNAFFSPTGAVTVGGRVADGVMVFGQGTEVDLAYDAEIVYHELTHAAVDATAAFEELYDPLGANADPGALNEGTADTFSFAHVVEALAAKGLPVDGASCLSRYLASELGLRCLRDARNVKTCLGNGPNDGRNPGRDGEVHDDGEIWTGFTWALLEAAHAHGERDAMARALFRALEAETPHASFPSYAATVLQATSDVGMSRAAVDFTACTVKQRDLDACGDGLAAAPRAVALFSGERAQGVFWFGARAASAVGTAGQQYYLDVPCGARALHVEWSDAGGAEFLAVKYGAPLTVRSTGLPLDADWHIAGSRPDVVLAAGKPCTGCEACSGRNTPLGAGRWWFLPVGSVGQVQGTFAFGVSIEMEGGAAPPARVPWLIDATHNVCRWGVDATPSGELTSPAAADTACAPPAPSLLAGGAAAGCVAASGGAGPPATASKPSGCGCGTAGGADLALVVAALAGLRRHPVRPERSAAESKGSRPDPPGERRPVWWRCRVPRAVPRFRA